MNQLLSGLALVLLLLLTFGARSIGFEHAYAPIAGAGTDVAPAEVVLAADDAQYHARRARYTFENFPQLLLWDPYLNFPSGAYVPWPPLYDFALGAFAVGLGALGADRAAVLGHVLVWTPVLLAMLTALLVYWSARQLAGQGAALLATAFFALLPVAILTAAVANPDHHAIVGLLGTAMLALSLASLQPGVSARRLGWLQLGLVVVRVSIVLCWQGSISYLALGALPMLAAALTTGRRDLLIVEAAGNTMAAVLLAQLLQLPHSELAGLWSPIEQSRLQPGALLAVAAVAGGCALWQVRGAGTPILRLARGVGLSLGVGTAMLLATDLREGLGHAWSYASGSEPFIAKNFESQPLFGDLGTVLELFGWGGLLLPLLPFVPALARWLTGGRVSAAATFYAIWTLALTVAAFSTARFAKDLAPAAAIGLGIGLSAIVASLLRGRSRSVRLSGGMAVAMIAVLLAQPVIATLPGAARSLDALAGVSEPARTAGLGLTKSMTAFADRVREATPPVSGYDDPSLSPEYGVLCPPTMGFIVKSRARRPTPAGNFGPYVGDQGLRRTIRFYRALDEERAVALAARMQVRYVITSLEGRATPEMLVHRLHQRDGSHGAELPALARFRLVTEAPARGVPLGALDGSVRGFVPAPYKLFEIVRGAVLRIEASPGSSVDIGVEIETPIGRRFRYASRGTAGEDGVARIRVPYPTADRPVGKDPMTPVLHARTVGPYEVRTEVGVRNVRVTERQVLSGLVVPVPPPLARQRAASPNSPIRPLQSG